MMKFVIIGIGQFGRALALHLADLGFEVTILDERESIITELKDRVTYALVGDATDIRVLRQLELVGEDTYVVVAVGEQFERNLLITAQLKELGVLNLLTRSVNELHGKLLKLIGVSDLIRVEEVAARQLAARFTNEGLMRLRRMDATHSLADVHLPAEWVGRKLLEVGLRSEYHLNLLTVRRGKVNENHAADDVLSEPEQPVIDMPDASLEFLEGDVLVLFGKDSDLQRFVEKFDLQGE
ncbi:MAG: TrkA family potassium uptake protein [Akkermansia sp.]|nr:TrkA family potassium uptake protein [Akkermansia sp.]MEE1265381.1 TrkA family potassium uptake protein [Akkermansia sp.]